MKTYEDLLQTLANHPALAKAWERRDQIPAGSLVRNRRSSDDCTPVYDYDIAGEVNKHGGTCDCCSFWNSTVEWIPPEVWVPLVLIMPAGGEHAAGPVEREAWDQFPVAQAEAFKQHARWADAAIAEKILGTAPENDDEGGTP